MRDSVVGFVKPRLDRLAVVHLNTYDPDYTFAGGRKVTSMDDFDEAILHEPWDNAQRGRVDFIQNGMWGPSNQLCLTLTNTVQKLFKISYTSHLCNGTKPKKAHQGGSIKKAIVRIKGSAIVNRVRNKTRMAHKEILYRRNHDITDSKHVAHMIDSTVPLYGFNGRIGLCHGHVMLFQITFNNSLENAKNMLRTPTGKGTRPDPQAPAKDLFAKWLAEKQSAGRTLAPEDEALVKSLTSAAHLFDSPRKPDNDDDDDDIPPLEERWIGRRKRREVSFQRYVDGSKQTC